MEKQQTIKVAIQSPYLQMALGQQLQHTKTMEMDLIQVMYEFIVGTDRLGQSQVQILMEKQHTMKVAIQSPYLQMALGQPLEHTKTMEMEVIQVMYEFIVGTDRPGQSQDRTLMEKQQTM